MMNTLIGIMEKEIKENKETILGRLHAMLLESKPLIRVWMYSVMLEETQSAKVMEEFIKYVIDERKLEPNLKFYLYNQIASLSFSYRSYDNSNSKYLRWKLLEQIVSSYENETQDLLKYIPYEQRNQNLVFVIVPQILSGFHAPTKMAFDKAKFLMEHMHKKVLVINTAEFLSKIIEIVFYKPFYSEYIDSYLYKESIAWKGADIPYFQCENNMPNTADLRALLQTVMNVKPGLVIAIGGGSILANLIDKMIPVLTYGTTGNLQETMTSCQTLSGKLEEAELQLLGRMGIKETSIIPIQPKVNPDMQKSVVTRKELKLPENKFIVAVAGNRLDSEIDESFMQMLERVLDEDMAAAAIGTRFHSYEKYMQMMPGLRNKVQYLGYSADLLAWLEVCDVYVNPYRVGGGVSATDALLKGLPVITMDYGDVAVCAGKEFCTESYDTMPDLIRKYKDDAEFYQKMSVLAKERAQTLIDTPEELQSIIEEFQRRTSGDLSISGENKHDKF
jgi:glycosyltransferase involved in cell wall biosynthesis